MDRECAGSPARTSTLSCAGMLHCCIAVYADSRGACVCLSCLEIACETGATSERPRPAAVLVGFALRLGSMWKGYRLSVWSPVSGVARHNHAERQLSSWWNIRRTQNQCRFVASGQDPIGILAQARGLQLSTRTEYCTLKSMCRVYESFGTIVLFIRKLSSAIRHVTTRYIYVRSKAGGRASLI